MILLIRGRPGILDAPNVRDVPGEPERDNIVVYSLVMPRTGKDLIRKTISVKDAKTAFHRDDIGFAAGVDLSEMAPEIFRGGKASAGEDDLTIVASELGGRRIAFRTLHGVEMALTAFWRGAAPEIRSRLHARSYDPASVRREHSGSVRTRSGYYVP